MKDTKEMTLQSVEIFQGMQPILAAGNVSNKIESAHDKPLLFPVYNSSPRSICLQICGWNFERKDSLDQALTKYGCPNDV